MKSSSFETRYRRYRLFPIELLWLWALCLLSPFQTRAALAFNYPDFASSTCINLQGNALVTNSVLRVTPSAENQLGTAWHCNKLPFGSGFSTDFTFRITDIGCWSSLPQCGGDGFGFIIQNLGPQSFTTDTALEQGADTNNICVTFNTFWNWPGNYYPEPSDNFIGLLINQQWITTTDLNPLAINMSDGAVHAAHINFDGANLLVQLDGVLVLSNALGSAISTALDSSGMGWVGFGARCGAAWENHDILNWSLSTGQSPACATLPAGAVSWWRAEGNTADALGANPGASVNGVTFASGEVAQAFVFNGTNNYVEVADSPSLQLTNELTIEFWVQRLRLVPPSLPYSEYIVEKGGDWTAGTQNYAVALHNPNYNYCLHFLFNGGWRGGGSVADTNWHHCAVVAHNGDVDPVLYIDGIPQPITYREGASSINLFPSNRPLHIGAQVDPSSGWFYYGQERLDELTIYSRALSAAEIQVIYNAGSGGKCVSHVGPSIISQPTNQTVQVGGNANFQVVAAGDVPLAYQWWFNGSPIAGQTTTSISLLNVQPSNAGNYSVSISNDFGSVLSTNALLTVIAQSNCVAAPPGLVAWWRGEGNALDSAGSNNGLLLGAVSFAPAIVGQGFQLDGAGSYIRIPPSSSLSLSNQFTIELWYKAARTNDQAEGLVSKRNSEVGPLNYAISIIPGIRVDVFYNDPNVVDTDDPGGTFELSRFTPAPPANDFHHLAATYRQASTNSVEVRTFLDGQLVRTRMLLGNLNNAVNSAPVTIGASVEYPTYEYFEGIIDEVSIYNRALSTNEIFSIYLAAGAGKCAGSIAPYLISQPTNQTIYAGASATFAVLAGGSPPLSYQWWFNGSPLTGQNAASLTIPNAQPFNSGNYSVNVSNGVGAVLSSNATLTVVSNNIPVPIITSFSPVSGAPGSSVHIVGLNFSPVASQNIVYFGAVQAPVIAASANSVTVLVPTGATYAPITETAGGLTASANTAFLPSFSGHGALDASSFAPRQDIGVNSGPYRVAIGDLDGDGRPDLVVVHAYSSDVWILRNIGTNANLGAASFAAPVILPIGGGTDSLLGLSLTDLDGDGRLDIVVANHANNNVTIFQNLAAPGVLSSNSFAGRIDLPAGLGPVDIAVRDLDGDGRPDIVTANYGNDTLSVIRNLSSSGILSTASFAAEFEIPGASGVHAIALADMDGDGRPDLIAATSSGNSDLTSIYRNVSSPGTLNIGSFAPRVDFPGGGEMVVTGDLDRDGKLDIAVGSWQKQVISIFQNSAISGVISSNSLAPRVDFIVGANVHHLALGDLDGDGLPDFAVACELPSQLSLFKNRTSPGTITSASFGPRVDMATGWNADGVAIGDLDSDGRPDIAFGNAYDVMISLYRNITPFTNQPPGCLLPPAGLISWWPAQGNTMDVMGSNNGSPVGNTAYGPSEVGLGFTFDGNVDAVTIGAATNLQLQDFTIETWFQRADTTLVSGGPGLDALFFGYGSQGYGFGLDSAGHPLLTKIDVDSVIPGITITDTNAHHLAVTKLGSSVIFYVDGIAYSTAPYSSTFDFSTSAALGARGDFFGNSFKGIVDELSIYGRALTAAEIDAIYNAGSAGKCRNPIPPLIVAQPSSQNVYGGDSVTLAVVVTGDAPLSYQWSFDGNPIPGQTSPALYFNPVQANNSGTYAVQVMNSAGTVLSSNATLAVLPTPPCAPVPQGVISWWKAESTAADSAGSNNGSLVGNTVYRPGRVGQAFVFDGDQDAVVVGNPANLQLQNFTIETWIKRADPAISSFGTHQDALLFGYGSGGYGFGLMNDGRLFLTRVDIDNVTISNGVSDTNYHHVAVTKTNSTVVFYIDGIAYPAPDYVTTYTFSTPAAISSRADTSDDSFFGSIDELTVYDHALTSFEIADIYNAARAGKCQIPIPPTITTQPTNVTVYSGSNATFLVRASGDTPLSYQWFFNNTPLAGRTTSTLTLSAVQPTNAGTYFAIVSNAVGTATSSNAVLTVNPLPDCAPVSLGLVSWWRGESNLLDSIGNNNGTQPVRVPLIQFGQGKVGRAFNLNLNYLLVPDSLSLRVTNAATIEAWINPASVTGIKTILSKVDGQTLPPQTNSSYLFGINNGLLTFTISRNGLQTTTTRVTSTQAIPTNQWSHVAATYDGTAIRLYINGSFSAQVSYSFGIFAGSNPVGIGAIPTGSFISDFFTGLIDEISLYNRALSDSELASIYTADVVGKCVLPPVITLQPQSQSIPQGEDVKFTIGIFGLKPLRYQWSFNGNILPGATNSSLLFEKIQTNRAGAYSVFVSNSAGSVTSDVATLTLLPPPSCTPAPSGIISWWPADSFAQDIVGTNNTIGGIFSTGKVKQAFTFNGIINRVQVNNSDSLNFGAGVDFSIETWIKAFAGTNVESGSNTIVPLVEKRTLNGAGGIGFSFFLNQGNLALGLSSTTPLSPLATFVSSGPDLRDGMFHHVAVTLARHSPASGVLYVDGQPVLTFIPSTTSLSNSSLLYIGGPTSTLTGAYFNGLIDEMTFYNRALSGSEILAIRQGGAAGKCIPPANIYLNPSNTIANVGSQATFHILASGYPTLHYQWFRNQTNQVGASTTFLNLANVTPADAGNYSCVVSNIGGYSTSAVAVLLVNSPPIAQNLNAATKQNQQLSISIEKILAGASDPDGDVVSLNAVSAASTNGATIVRTSDNVVYTPVSGYIGSDSFAFTVTDGRGGTSFAFVFVQVNSPDLSSSNMLPPVNTTDGIVVSFAGIPGQTYTLQRAPSANGPWTTLTSVTVGTNGIATYTDTNPLPDAGFYRTVYP